MATAQAIKREHHWKPRDAEEEEIVAAFSVPRIARITLALVAGKNAANRAAPCPTPTRNPTESPPATRTTPTVPRRAQREGVGSGAP